MDKKQLANVIAAQVWSYGGIIYGGWVRDVIIIGQDDFRDLNVLFQDSTSVQTFVEFLQSNYSCFVYPQQPPGGVFTPSRNLEVNGILPIRIFQMTMKDLIEQKYCDLSCNLFYKLGPDHLDAFWIPSNWSSLEELVAYTKTKKFIVILTPGSNPENHGSQGVGLKTFYYPLSCRKRIWRIVQKGWQLGARFLTDDIKAAIPPDFLDEVIAIENAFAPPSEEVPSQ
jgi:hypothetical protein